MSTHCADDNDVKSLQIKVKDESICDTKDDNDRVIVSENKTGVKEEIIVTVREKTDQIESVKSIYSEGGRNNKHASDSIEQNTQAMALHYKKLKYTSLSNDINSTIDKKDVNHDTPMNMNVSLIDQIKINRNKDTWNNNVVNNTSGPMEMNEGLGYRTAAVPAQISAHGTSSTEPKTRAPPLSNHSIDSRASGTYGDMKGGHSDNRPVNVVAPTTANMHVNHRTNNSSIHNPKTEDIKRCNSVEAKMSEEHRKLVTSSPLLINSNEPVKVYRDPELLKRDEIIQAAAVHTTPSTISTLPSPHTITAGLSLYNNAEALGEAHFGRMGTHCSSLQYTQQQQQLLQAQAQILASAPYVAAAMAGQQVAQTNRLELLWQQKYPQIAMPPAWMLGQYQEELLRNSSILNKHAAMERERGMLLARKELAERELLERERSEREHIERYF